MGSTDKFCLRWNDFESNISTSFRDLRLGQEFFDVSLAVEEDQVVQAHKVILAACSPFFRNVLAKQIMATPYGYPHPVIYLRGIKVRDLRHVLDFMYHGEVNVAQEELSSFLAVAEDLQIKGLTQDDNQVGAKQPAPVRHKSEALKRGEPPDRDENGPPTKKRSSSNISPSVPEENIHVSSVKQESLADLDVAYGEDTAQFADAGEEDFTQYEAGDGYDEPQPGTSDGLKGKPFQFTESELESVVAENLAQIDNGFACLICGSKISHKRNAKRHFRMVHMESTCVYVCPGCKTEFAKAAQFDYHIRHHEPQLKGLKASSCAVSLK